MKLETSRSAQRTASKSPPKGSPKDSPKSISSLDHEFEFISVQNPEEAKDREKRRQARSHALKYSLKNKRLRQKAESTDSFPKQIWQPTQTGLALVLPGAKSQQVLLAPLYTPSASVPDPFKTLAVDSSKLKQLLDQYVTPQSIEPIFTIEDEVAFQTFRSVFRTGLDDPALLNAIMLAFTFGASGGTIDQQCLDYKGQAIHYIRERMNGPIRAPMEPILGAILLIAGVEARLGMRAQVQIHMKGIQQLLTASASAGVHLSDGIKRAIFWQDLNAALMSGSERVVDHTTFAELGWRRDPFSHPLFEIPQGFQSVAHLFTDEFIELVEDINALQRILDSPNFVDDSIALMHIDSHQASIESRLWSLPKSTPFQECCSYAAYLSANLLCCKVWRTSAIPSYLSSQILRTLRQTIDSSVWDENPRLLLWLLYMGGSVARDAVVRSEYVTLLESNLATRYKGLDLTWSKLLEVMELFFWLERGFGPTVRAFWEQTRAVMLP
ncbi:hypothetical protein GQ53DRAFT_835105 [Thozetella sp. PMI_491]|nr:hypothetical protein GQ53DRAFT_835105 [Thozetella sp. PMI_491]